MGMKRERLWIGALVYLILAGAVVLGVVSFAWIQTRTAFFAENQKAESPTSTTPEFVPLVFPQSQTNINTTCGGTTKTCGNTWGTTFNGSRQ